MGVARIALIVAVSLAGLLSGVWIYFEHVANPRVVRELTEEPAGDRARKVMLLTLPSGRRVPVNYLREGNRIYAGADGRWWKELAGEPREVQVLLRGERLRGRARAVLDDPATTRRVFSKLRPNAVKGLGTLIEIRLEK